MSEAYQCDDCEETFGVELLAYTHSKRDGHTVRYYGDE